MLTGVWDAVVSLVERPDSGGHHVCGLLRMPAYVLAAAEAATVLGHSDARLLFFFLLCCCALRAISASALPQKAPTSTNRACWTAQCQQQQHLVPRYRAALPAAQAAAVQLLPPPPSSLLAVSVLLLLHCG